MALQTIKRYLSVSNGNPTQSTDGVHQHFTNGSRRKARYVAEQMCSGFQLHDRRQHDDAVEAFYEVDRAQFAQLSDDAAFTAAEAYVDALWAKDEIEKQHTTDGGIDPELIRDADYSTVREPLVRRAAAVGMSEEYAEKTTTAWHNHKTGDDYWTPFMRAQTLELRIALQDPDYPDKPRGGQAGFGPLATRYAVGVELHDMHSTTAWEEAIRLMTSYYQQILEAHDHR